MHIYNWFIKQKKKVNSAVKMDVMPVDIKNSNTPKIKLSSSVISALGGTENIDTCRCVPNSKRIRLTVHNSSAVKNEQLEQIDTYLFIRVGKKIIHVIS